MKRTGGIKNICRMNLVIFFLELKLSGLLKYFLNLNQLVAPVF